MGKNPAFQWYPRDWLSDPELQQACASVRGIWINLLAHMWFSTTRGMITCTIRELARLGGCTDAEVKKFISDIQRLKFGDVTFSGNFPDSDSSVTLCNRRMVREEKLRHSGAERQARLREKGGGDPERWTAIRIRILERDNRVCAYCGKHAVTVDHIIPKSKGGDETDTNLVACCKSCNYRKNNRRLDECGMSLRKSHLSDISVTSPSPSPTPSPTTNTTEKYIVGQAPRQASNGHLADAKDVLGFLNRRSGKNFRLIDTNLHLIVARLNSGILPAQLKAIVSMKLDEWGQDARMAKFIRPATLFNKTNCEQYLGELPKL